MQYNRQTPVRTQDVHNTPHSFQNERHSTLPNHLKFQNFTHNLQEPSQTLTSPLQYNLQGLQTPYIQHTCTSQHIFQNERQPLLPGLNKSENHSSNLQIGHINEFNNYTYSTKHPLDRSPSKHTLHQFTYTSKHKVKNPDTFYGVSTDW